MAPLSMMLFFILTIYGMDTIDVILWELNVTGEYDTEVTAKPLSPGASADSHCLCLRRDAGGWSIGMETQRGDFSSSG